MDIDHENSNNDIWPHRRPYETGERMIMGPKTASKAQKPQTPKHLAAKPYFLTECPQKATRAQWRPVSMGRRSLSGEAFHSHGVLADSIFQKM